MKKDEKTTDYLASINKASRRRKRPSYKKCAVIAAILCVTAAAGITAAVKLAKKEPAVVAEVDTSSPSTETLESDPAASSGADESLEAENEKKQQIEAVIDSYPDLGIAKVSGYLNIRKNMDEGSPVVGKLLDGSACNILETNDGWYRVASGSVEGYAKAEYLLTGEEAKTAARDLVKEMAVSLVDNLNIRQEPSTSSGVVGQCLEGERYELVGETEGWYQIPGGYISAEFSEKKYCLNEARKLDLRAMVLNYYDRPGVSNVTNYLNIRDGAGEDAKIIGKLPSHAGCEILEDLNGWYKIRSGNINGYVKSDYILTGDAAREAAMSHAELMAIVNTDRLNARTEPSTEAKIWTQISNNERYHVAEQLDGWVKIEFDESGAGDGDGDEITSAYVSTDYVDVRYALPEAIKFSPSEEKSSLRSQIVNYAMKFLGNPYVWGGTSLTKGADCSGFTMSVLKQFGISLPHYSGDQAKRGTRIKSSQMQPGDLIFYGNKRGTINHVAMYIGNGQIIHAASRRSGIKISTWNYRTPLKIVNVIGK